MPSLTTKRQVRYTKADLDSLRGTIVLLQFARDFDEQFVMADATLEGLEKFTAHVEKQRNTTKLVAPPKK